MRERMDGARPVKNAQWYELSVAARLNAYPVKIGEAELDLTDFYFDPNHRPYTSKLTNAGYSAEIDIIATKSNVQFNISCKFSEKPEQILRSGSQEFLETILEFIPLTQIEDSLNLQMNYILATNFMISKELSQRRDWEFNKNVEVSERVIRFGRKKYGDKFNADLFQADSLRRLLTHLHLLIWNVNEFEALYEKDNKFQKAFDILYRRLLNVPRQGLSLHDIVKSDVVIFCDSSDHKKCNDTIIENRTCHIGSLNTIKMKLGKILEAQPFQLITEVSGVEIGLTPSRVKSFCNISPEGICRILNSIFNNRQLLKIRYPHTFYVLPVTFNILAFEPFALAKRIKATEDELKKVHPTSVVEIQQLGLGPRTIEDITVLAYLHGFGYCLPSTDIVINTDRL